MAEQQPNFILSGEEARLLMVALATSPAQASTQATILLWSRLNDISQVQPPQQQEA